MPTPPTALLTGAGGVFGFWIAFGLLAAGVRVHAVVRDAAKGAALAARLAAAGADTALLQLHAADLDASAAIAALAAALPPALDLLINNAAATAPARRETAAGVELQWSTNVLAYHRLLKAVAPRLRAAAAPRAILVASNYAGGLDLRDPEFKARAYDGDAAYRASKEANRMLAASWAAELAPHGVRVHGCHPGVATSAVSLGLGFDLDRSEAAARAGAATPLLLALGDAARLAPSGAYYSDGRARACAFAADAARRAELWALVESYDAAGE